ncbi:hypothetical protein MLD38_027345 [Melastoma candidum]|uniref:Uncharacterized protein n=1 Tax=Melastoma candidum TaxID=119954 RepID=A0ACB9P3B2_9MYRT|nr:hypothetical protein MLD38_027345 [Melastoma candidum]
MLRPFLLLVSFLALLSSAVSHPPLRATLIDCGATSPTPSPQGEWLPDADFVSSGTPLTLPINYADPTLNTLRTFPLHDGRKFCYEVPVFRGARYMVRTTYFYGGIGGDGSTPPVFKQIVDGTVWSLVNTTADYARNMATYYEGYFLATGKTMSVCLGVDEFTDSDPFISALELVVLGDSVYNTTDFEQYGLSLVERSSFGYTGPTIRYPDDPYDRFWEPYARSGVPQTSMKNVTVSGFWNLPPLKVFEQELIVPVLEQMDLQWPTGILDGQSQDYYIALYFADDQDSIATPRILNITVNSVPYYSNLTISSAGVTVFASEWPLTGQTKLKLAPAPGSQLGPLLNAGEVLERLQIKRKTHTRDVIALEKIKSSLRSYPSDWSGDPCMPDNYPWTGVSCSYGRRYRVTALNLTNMGISGSLSPNFANLTALTSIVLDGNKLSGYIPDLSSLRNLELLHLNDNQLSGPIPSSLGSINSLRELYLQNNDFTGEVPKSLERPGLDLKTYGNKLSSTPSS